jgi:hypothetical protein
MVSSALISRRSRTRAMPHQRKIVSTLRALWLNQGEAASDQQHSYVIQEGTKFVMSLFQIAA